jgi:hypothetical protein
VQDHLGLEQTVRSLLVPYAPRRSGRLPSSSREETMTWSSRLRWSSLQVVVANINIVFVAVSWVSWSFRSSIPAACAEGSMGSRCRGGGCCERCSPRPSALMGSWGCTGAPVSAKAFTGVRGGWEFGAVDGRCRRPIGDDGLCCPRGGRGEAPGGGVGASGSAHWRPLRVSGFRFSFSLFLYLSSIWSY